MIRFTFKTKDGRNVPVFEPPPALTDEEREFLNLALRRKYGNERRPADSFYNCHGLCFISRLGWLGIIERGVKRLIVPGQINEIINFNAAQNDISVILKGNRFRRIYRINNREIDKLPPNIDVKLGDVLIYKELHGEKEFTNHSALVFQVTSEKGETRLIALSKFGKGGEYFHDYMDIPDEYGNIIEVWSDR